MDNGRPVQLPVTPDIQTQAPPDQPVQPGQRVYDQSTPGHQEQPQAGQGLDLTIDTDFLKSPLCYIKIAEFVVLLCAWASVVKYLDDFYQLYPDYQTDDKEARYFNFIAIFCWVMVILCLVIKTFSVPSFCKWRRPSVFTAMSLIFYFIMFALLLAYTGKLVYRTAFLGNWLQKYTKDNKGSADLDKVTNRIRPFVVSLGVASTQRAQETPPDQGSPKRRAWDINTDYLRSPVFYVKLIEIALLFAAWVCIVKYFADITRTHPDVPFFYARQPEDSKVDFFKGVTILSWVMVILLALTSALSFDKFCSRSSPWTLTTVIIYFILSILLIASCGNLTPRAVELKKRENIVLRFYDEIFLKSVKLNILALQIGLACGFLCCIVFVVDMVLSFKLYLTQRAQETSLHHGPYQRRAGDVNTKYLRSPMFYVKLAEIAFLFAAWVCILKYFYFPVLFDDGYFNFGAVTDSKTILFRGIVIFSWAMVILLALTSVFSFDKLFRRSSSWSLMTLIIYFILLILLSACCGNLTPWAVYWGESYKRSDETVQPFTLARLLGLAFGFSSCLLFFVDMVLNYKLYQTQRAQEASSDQGPPQKRAENVNTNYLQSSVFDVKLTEIVLLFVAWVCIVNYFDFALDIALRADEIHEDLKADFFKGVTVLCWVMANILALSFALRLDKLYSLPSRCTLTTLIIHFILFILLITCCGFLTPRAIDLGKQYKSLSVKDYNSWPAIALLTGLGFGYISWLIFVLDICLLCMLYQKQRAEEVRHPQQADQAPDTQLRQPAPDQAPDTQLRQPAPDQAPYTQLQQPAPDQAPYTHMRQPAVVHYVDSFV
ncbi:uncharacterized protein LOC144649950 isoform X2 [Oculina patagonica]